MKKTSPLTSLRRTRAVARLLLFLPAALWHNGQAQTPQPPPQATADESITRLSPFEVTSQDSNGYVATSTLGGTLIRTNLSDVGSAISVYTKEFLEDLGAFDNETLLAFTVNSDVGGVRGTWVNANSQGEENENFGAGNSNTRIRGLAAADNTSNYFKSDAPWDGYNTDRIDVIRGANSILFGLGSPAGIINASTLRANERNRGRFQFRTDEHGSMRGSIDYNQVVRKNELSVRLALLHNDQKFKQDAAFKTDERFYATAKWAPKFLQSRNSRFNIEVMVEKGDVESNTRRAQPPTDNLTYFFLPQSEGGLAGQTVNRLNPAHESRLYVDFGTPTQRLNPLLSNAWGNGTIVLVYDGSAQPVSIFEKEINSVNGYRFANNAAVINSPTATGSSATSISGSVQPVFFNGFAAYATLKGLPFASRYQDRVLTDTSIYNFYEKLIDGESKRENRAWTNGKADLTHSFLNNKFSYNLQYFSETMEFDRYAALGSNSTIEVDAGELLPDGRPNPNAGRAYIKESPFTGSRAQFIDREAWRAVAFAQHDFRKKAGNKLLRAFGHHMVTGTLSQQNVDQRRFDYMSNGVGEDWIASRLVASNPLLINQFNTPARTLNYFYISGNLAGKQLGTDLGLRNVGPGAPPVTGNYTYRYFDADYRKFNPAVNPAATDALFGRAAQNPANYAGWTNGSVKLYGAPTDEASREYLTRARDYFKERTDSKAFAWQGKFLGDAVVGTWGWREDNYRSWVYSWSNSLGALDREKADYRFAPIEKTGSASNWSVALHANKLFPKLPLDLTYLYGKGENTNPDPSRIGVFREPILSAQGKTSDHSLVVSTKDNKWSLRATRYETSVANSSSTSTLQSQKFLLEQAFFQAFQGVYRTLGERTELYGSVQATLEAREAAGTITAVEQTRLNLQRENIPKNVAASNAWLGFEQRFANKFPDAVSAWKPADGTFPGSINSPGMRWTYPENAVLTEDAVSKGWEVELVANPTQSWRVAFNASRTEAIRDNIPGPRFKEVMEFINEEFQTEVGRVPIFADNNGAPGVNNTPRERFAGLWDAYQVQLQQNGQRVSELSEWRFNFVNNYSFRTGLLKGFSVGGNYRYESPKTIGYGYRMEGTRVVTDLTQAFNSEAYDTVGLSFGYRRKLRDRYNWSIQLNIDNVLQAKDELTATAVQPDGSMRRAMIREGRSWSVTNTLEF
jgi:outer membrane receptor protein involved in Fe transport